MPHAISELNLVIETDTDLGTAARAEQVLRSLRVKPGWLPTKYGTHEPLRARFDGSRPDAFIEAWVAANGPGRVNSFHFTAVRRYHAAAMWRPKRDALNSLHFAISSESSDEAHALECLNMGIELFAAVNGQYGRLCTREEYGVKNMTDSWIGTDGRREGGRAHGTDRRKHLPGIYWANIFGPAYADFFGEEKLTSAPAYSIERRGHSWVMLITASPHEWSTTSSQQRADAVRRHLGADAFFDLQEPDRPTRAPRFELSVDG